MKSLTSSGLSRRMKTRSNLDRRALPILLISNISLNDCVKQQKKFKSKNIKPKEHLLEIFWDRFTFGVMSSHWICCCYNGGSSWQTAMERIELFVLMLLINNVHFIFLDLHIHVQLKRFCFVLKVLLDFTYLQTIPAFAILILCCSFNS